MAHKASDSEAVTLEALCMQAYPLVRDRLCGLDGGNGHGDSETPPLAFHQHGFTVLSCSVDSACGVNGSSSVDHPVGSVFSTLLRVGGRGDC